MLRREIQLLTQPATVEEPEKPEEIVEPEPELQEEEIMQEVNGVTNGDTGEEVKVEEDEVKEDEIDEEGLFSSEFDNLMDPNGYQTDMGFGEDMDWIVNDV